MSRPRNEDWVAITQKDVFDTGMLKALVELQRGDFRNKLRDMAKGNPQLQNILIAELNMKATRAGWPPGRVG